jgi:GYF domain 2
MSGPASETQWYLAREGKQHGPISEAELTKFIEQGHLQPNDLVWRDGFTDWRPAMLVFPPRGGPAASRPVPLRQRPVARQPEAAAADPAYGPDFDDAGGGPRFRPLRVAVVLLLLVAITGAGALAYLYPARVSEFVASFTTSSGATTIADRRSLDVPPLAGFRGGTAETIETHLQATALWRVIKREFPDWYAQRLSEAAALARDNKDDAAIGQHMGAKLRELRRQQAANGLQATQQLLRNVAMAFFDNLVKLRAHSPQACHALIDGGEANPAIVALLQGSEFTPGLQAQLTAVFEAIAEGRRQPRVHIRPVAEEFQKLAGGLAKMGWTQEDMVLFNDPRAFAKAPPEKVCQLVHDFFKAHVDFADPDGQIKLIINALPPVFAG